MQLFLTGSLQWCRIHVQVWCKDAPQSPLLGFVDEPQSSECSFGLVPDIFGSAASVLPPAALAPMKAEPAAAAAFAGLESDEPMDSESEEEEERPAARVRSGRAGTRSAAAAQSAPAGALAFGDDASLDRKARVARWREKRKNRKFAKTIRYASRKAYADIRPRIKGRFARKEEVEAWKNAGCPKNFWDNHDQVVPCM